MVMSHVEAPLYFLVRLCVKDLELIIVVTSARGLDRQMIGRWDGHSLVQELQSDDVAGFLKCHCLVEKHRSQHSKFSLFRLLSSQFFEPLFDLRHLKHLDEQKDLLRRFHDVASWDHVHIAVELKRIDHCHIAILLALT